MCGAIFAQYIRCATIVMDKKQDWFRAWFDSPYYHMLYGYRDEVEAKDFISKVLLELELPESAIVMDLACGRGRHSVHLHSSGLNVIGLDLSTENIAFAKKFEEKGLEFHVHDMRDVFREDAFDSVFNLFTSFGYFNNYDENLQVIKAIYGSLKENGRLVFDFLNPLKHGLPKAKDEELEVDGVRFAISKKVENDIFVKRINVQDGNVSLHFEERVKAFDVYHLTSMMEIVGFKVQKVLGNYNLEPFVEAISDRTILICRK